MSYLSMDHILFPERMFSFNTKTQRIIVDEQKTALDKINKGRLELFENLLENNLLQH